MIFDKSKIRKNTNGKEPARVNLQAFPAFCRKNVPADKDVSFGIQQQARSGLPLLVVSMLAAALMLQFCLSPAMLAAEKTFIYRTSNKTEYSTRLGVITVPALVVMDNKRHPGLFITTSPTLELGRNMRLAPGMVLLTIDGYSMTTREVADKWLSSRSNNQQILYTYAIVQGSKPKICSGQVRAVAASAPAQNQTMAVQAKAVSTDELVQYCLSLVNESRRSGGATPVRIDSGLSRLAQRYADYMAEHAEQYEVSNGRSPHTDLQGRSPADRARESGISTTVLENIGRASRSAFDPDKGIVANLHRQMMSEPAGVPNHRSTIMDPQNTAVGIGIARSPNRFYMAQEFGY